MKVLKNNFYMLGYILRYTPMMAAGMLLCTILQAVGRILFGTILLKYIIDSVQYNRSFSEVLTIIGALFIYGTVQYLFSSWFNDKYLHKAKEILHEKMQTELFDKAINMDLACYDNPKFYNDFVWATSEADKRAVAVLDSLSLLLEDLITFSTITVLATMWDPMVFWFILASFLISFSIGFLRNKVRYKYNIEIKPKERKRDYINRVFYLPDYAKEIRLTDIKGIMLKKLEENKNEMINCTNRHIKKIWGLNVLSSAFGDTIILDMLVVIYLAFKVVVAKTLSYGSFVALVNAVWQIKWSLQEFVDTIPKFAEHSLYIENFKTFLSYKSCMVDNPEPARTSKKPGKLVLKNVSFTYSGNSEPTLKNINITINPYEKIALVGHNGAGKSTLIKLIMRLYEVSEGEITLEGRNIRDYSLKDYRGSFGAVFQDYQIYAASICDNVMMGRTGGKNNEEVQNKVKEALTASGFSEKLGSLKAGINTQLTREFHDDGTNLSGGESQKIAIARTFARNGSFIVLDEPSSALDPVSEYNLNHTMMDAARDKSVVLISHRLSTTRMADKIYMLENGEIIEEGTHEQLMARQGKYAEMFNMQAKRYIENAAV